MLPAQILELECLLEVRECTVSHFHLLSLFSLFSDECQKDCVSACNQIVWHKLRDPYLHSFLSPALLSLSNRTKNSSMRSFSSDAHGCDDSKTNDDSISDQTSDDYYNEYYKIFNPGPFISGNAFPGGVSTNPSDSNPQAPSDPVLTHTDLHGKANMVDVGHKEVTARAAVASARVMLTSEAFQLVVENRAKKGDVLTVSELAGIMAAKKTSDLIPLCHNIVLNKVSVKLSLMHDDQSVYISCEARSSGKTGAEMEALVGASVAALTVYDMCKAVSHAITITDVRLEKKSGGKSGDFDRMSLL